MTFNARRSFLIGFRAGVFACATVFAMLASPVHAATVTPGPSGTWNTSYDVTLNPGYNNVTNIVILQQGSNWGSSAWSFTALADPSRHDYYTTTLTTSLPVDSPPTESLMIGLTQGLPGDGTPGQEHVVLMMDDTAASDAANIAWGTLFRNTLESDIVTALLQATEGTSWDVTNQGLATLNAFASGDATTGILNPDGTSQSAWFSTNTSDSTFSILAFSGGTQIGSGTSSTNFVSSVPEPSTALALVSGLGITLLCGKARFRRRSIQA